MKPILFLDFDDTLVVTRHLVIQFLNSFYRIQIPSDMYLCGNSLEEVVNTYLPNNKQVTRHQLYDDYAINFLASKKIHDDAYPMEGTEIFIPQLALRYDLWVVTARQDGCRHVVENLCKKFFSRSIVGMHFVWKRVAPMQFSENASKKQFIASTRGEKIAFLDDNPNEVNDMYIFSNYFLLRLLMILSPLVFGFL